MNTVTQNTENCNGNHENKTTTQVLLSLCESIELFHSQDKEPYAAIVQNGYDENLLIYSTEFKMYLLQQYYQLKKSAPPDKVLQDVIKTLAAKAIFEGQKHTVYLRIANLGSKIYVDLKNENRQVIEIDATGCKILDKSPLKFRRTKGMEALPVPHLTENSVRSIGFLLNFLNIEAESDFKLLIAWLISCIGTKGPYPVLVLYGEQGTAKSTTVRVLRNFVDPNTSPLRRPPKSTEDLMITAQNNYVIAIDNMSYLTDSLSDDLCILSTGGGISKRKLYSDQDEVVLDAKRPIILNGIDEFVARGDLASRAIFLNLPVIQKNQRKPEEEFWKDLQKIQSWIFGAILTAVSEGLKNIETLVQTENERMADAWRFITAAETAFGWPKGTCVKIFQGNQQKANEVILNSSILYPFVNAYAELTNGFSGTAQILLTKIKNEASMFGLTQSELRFLPSSPKTLSDKLRRLAPSLRISGIEISFDKTSGSNSQRLIYIKRR